MFGCGISGAGQKPSSGTISSRRRSAGALQHQVHAEVAPWQGGRVAFGEGLDLLAVDDERTVAGADLAVVAPVDGVVPEQVGEVVRVGDVVDRDEVEFAAFVEQDLQGGPADSSQTVDGYGRHLRSPPWICPPPWSCQPSGS